jgi:hypothetical protein
VTKKAAPVPEKKKRKSIKRPEHGPPTMRLSVRKLRLITETAIRRKEAERLSKLGREAQDSEREAERQKGREIERARKVLVAIGKVARKAADDGLSSADVAYLTDSDIQVPYGVSYPTEGCLVGTARHVFKALQSEGFDATIVGNSSRWSIRIRWQ